MTIDYQVQLLQLPSCKTKELVVPNEDGSYTIFIQSSLSYEERQKALRHALKHILHHDFDKDNADDIEAYAHNYLNI